VGVLCLILAGFLAGGAWSFHRQGQSRVVVIAVGLLAMLALAAGVLWLV
jgi:membrane protein DedA with SNARE-associated domain